MKGKHLIRIHIFHALSNMVSGYPELGVSAIEHLIGALNSLLLVDWPSSLKFGKTTFNIGTINGGAAANIVPGTPVYLPQFLTLASASALCSIRAAADLQEIIALLKKTIEAHDGVKMDIEVAVSPVALDSDVPGFEKIVVSYSTVQLNLDVANKQDVANLDGDFKRYLYGPGSITTAHGPNEFVQKSDLLEAVEGYKKLLLRALQ